MADPKLYHGEQLARRIEDQAYYFRPQEGTAKVAADLFSMWASQVRMHANPESVSEKDWYLEVKELIRNLESGMSRVKRG